MGRPMQSCYPWLPKTPRESRQRARHESTQSPPSSEHLLQKPTGPMSSSCDNCGCHKTSNASCLCVSQGQPGLSTSSDSDFTLQESKSNMVEVVLFVRLSPSLLYFSSHGMSGSSAIDVKCSSRASCGSIAELRLLSSLDQTERSAKRIEEIGQSTETRSKDATRGSCFHY